MKIGNTGVSFQSTKEGSSDYLVIRRERGKVILTIVKNEDGGRRKVPFCIEESATDFTRLMKDGGRKQLKGVRARSSRVTVTAGENTIEVSREEILKCL